MPGKRKQKGAGALSDALNYVRDHKLISKGLGLIPDPRFQLASQVANMAGVGKKKCKRTQRGRGIFSDLGGGIGSVFGGLGSGIGSVAHGLFGGGKKRRPKKNVLVM